MRAAILGAGVGQRLQQPELPPKVMLSFGGETLLARHVSTLRHYGISQIDLVVGYRAERVEQEIASIGAEDFVQTIYNPEYERGSIVSFWSLRDSLASGEPILFMDGDVLYDHRMIRQLLNSPHENCFLMDRTTEEGEDPVKLCMTDEGLVDFHKRPQLAFDWWGEWIGFARFSPAVASEIFEVCGRIIDGGERDEMYETAVREVLLKRPSGTFDVEDVTGLPWVEIDFPEDLRRAREEIFPSLAALPAPVSAD